jgi:endonuclease G
MVFDHNAVGRIIVDDTAVEIAKKVSRDREGNYLGVPRQKKLEHLRAKGVSIAGNASHTKVDAAIERLIGDSNDLKPIAWLTQAKTVADAVALISMELPGEGAASATGFMISPVLMMTNHHVLGTAAQAAHNSVYVTFGYEKSPDNRPLADAENIALDPSTFFVSNEELDYAIIAVAQTSDRKLPGDKYGRLPLIKTPSKALPGSPLNIIQHPSGGYKQIAFRNNLMTDAETPNLAVYLTDTDPGSSGSPVFDDDFDLVALHHAGHDFTDKDGHKIDLNGDPVTPDTPEALRYWVANEGIRVSAIVADLEQQQLPITQRQLIGAAIV